MQSWLVLLLEAPLMSFGGPMIDQHGVTRPMPGRALLTGLLGNALGLMHRDAGRLERLQARLVHATLSLRPGDAMVDFHTVDLGQPFMRQGWTTRGLPQGREGGSAGSATHIRYRHYLADALRLVVLTLYPAAEEPRLDAVAAALEQPARPLFLGRKTCLPTRPLLSGRVEAADPVAALLAADALVQPMLAAETGPGDARSGSHDGVRAEWPVPLSTELPPEAGRVERLVDERDWTNQFHGGERLVAVAPLPGLTRAGLAGEAAR